MHLIYPAGVQAGCTNALIHTVVESAFFDHWDRGSEHIHSRGGLWNVNSSQGVAAFTMHKGTLATFQSEKRLDIFASQGQTTGLALATLVHDMCALPGILTLVRS